MTNVKKKDLHRPRKMATKDRDKAGKVARVRERQRRSSRLSTPRANRSTSAAPPEPMAFYPNGFRASSLMMASHTSGQSSKKSIKFF